MLRPKKATKKRSKPLSLPMLLGQVLRKWRVQKGLKQADIAELAGVTKQMISRYEQGVDPGIEFLELFALRFECTWFDVMQDLLSLEIENRSEERMAQRAEGIAEIVPFDGAQQSARIRRIAVRR